MDFRISPIDRSLQNEYEREVIRMLIGTDNEARKTDILTHCCGDMFTNKTYKTLFNTAVELKQENKPIEITGFIEKNKKESVKQLVIDISKEYITAANCRFYIEKITNAYIKRLLVECDSFEGYKAIEAVKNKYSFQNDTVKLSSDADALVMEYYNKWGTAIQTYYPSVDKALGTLQGGDLLILAGATGMGKTCMMLNLVQNIASNGRKVLLFSLEMTLKQLQNRIISANTGIDASKIRNFQMTDEEQQIYSQYALSDEFMNFNIDVCAQYNVTVEHIKSITEETEPDIVFIDYLGLVSSDIKGNSYERVSQVSRDLKLTALETNTPFIVLHQLSRIGTDRKEKRPFLSDLRDSGKIEQDADFICFVYRDCYYNDESPENDLEFIISKSRHGKGKCTCHLNYNGNTQKIKEFNKWI